MNLWHEITPGKNTPKEFNVIVEINKGSKNKYEIDKETGLIALDRVAHTAQDFPVDYGFVPQSYWHDEDPLDVILLTTHALLPGVLVKVRPVAIMGMIDDGDRDDKIIAVPVDDPRWEDVKDLENINKHLLREVEHFYGTYKKLQDKEVEVTGFKGRAEAEKAVEEGLKMYQEKFGK